MENTPQKPTPNDFFGALRYPTESLREFWNIKDDRPHNKEMMLEQHGLESLKDVQPFVDEKSTDIDVDGRHVQLEHGENGGLIIRAYRPVTEDDDYSFNEKEIENLRLCFDKNGNLKEYNNEATGVYFRDDRHNFFSGIRFDHGDNSFYIDPETRQYITTIPEEHRAPGIKGYLTYDPETSNWVALGHEKKHLLNVPLEFAPIAPQQIQHLIEQGYDSQHLVHVAFTPPVSDGTFHDMEIIDANEPDDVLFSDYSTKAEQSIRMPGYTKTMSISHQNNDRSSRAFSSFEIGNEQFTLDIIGNERNDLQKATISTPWNQPVTVYVDDSKVTHMVEDTNAIKSWLRKKGISKKPKFDTPELRAKIETALEREKDLHSLNTYRTGGSRDRSFGFDVSITLGRNPSIKRNMAILPVIAGLGDADIQPSSQFLNREIANIAAADERPTLNIKDETVAVYTQASQKTA